MREEEGEEGGARGRGEEEDVAGGGKSRGVQPCEGEAAGGEEGGGETGSARRGVLQLKLEAGKSLEGDEFHQGRSTLEEKDKGSAHTS